MKNNKTSSQISSVKEILLSRSELERLITRDSLKISSNRLLPEGMSPITHWRCCTYDGRSEDSYVFLRVDIKYKKTKKEFVLRVDSIKEIKPLSKEGCILLEKKLKDYKNEVLPIGVPYFPNAEKGFPLLEEFPQKSAILSRAERIRLEKEGFLLLDKTRLLDIGETIESHLSRFPDLQIDLQNIYYCEFKVTGEEGVIFKKFLTKDFYFNDNPLPSCESQTKSTPEKLEQLNKYIEEQLREERKQSAVGFVRLLNMLDIINTKNRSLNKFSSPELVLTKNEGVKLTVFEASEAYPIKAAFMVVTRKFAEEMRRERETKDNSVLMPLFKRFYDEKLKQLKEEIDELRQSNRLKESILDDPLCKKISEKLKETADFYCSQKKIGGKGKEKKFSPFSFEQLVFFFKYSKLFTGNELINMHTFFKDLNKLENDPRYRSKNIEIYLNLGSFLTKESFTSLRYFLHQQSSKV